MSEPASSTRRCPYCDATNPLEAVSCASCKHSLPPGESEEATGYLPATRRPGPREALPEDTESPTGYRTAPGRTDVDEKEAPTGYLTAPGSTDLEGEAPTDYSPHPGGRAAPGDRREDGPLEVGQKFGRYHIIKLLGLGGMGAVYRAWDEELGVAVAVKIVRPEIATDPELARDLEKRFKRELLLARQVTHPNVVRIHDMGEIGGIKYITMPYVDGVELASILKKNAGGLPVEQVVRVARGCGLRSRRGAQRGRRAPGPQAGQHHGRARHRPGHDHGLRDRPILRRGRSRREARGEALPGGPRLRPHDGGRHRRDAGVHGPRAVPGRGGGPPRRHLRLRPDPVRPAHRPSSEGRRPHGLRGSGPAGEEGPAPAGGGAAGRPRAPRADRHPVHPDGPRRALRHDRGAGGRHRPPRREGRAAAAAEAVPEGLPGGRVGGDPGGARGHVAAGAIADCRPRRRRRCRSWSRTSTT